MYLSGNLVNNKIIINKQKDSGKLYSRSQFGIQKSQHIIELDLIEGVFLLGEKKIKVFKNKKAIDFQTLFLFASQQIPELEIKYLIYKDLRNKGIALKFNSSAKQFTFTIKQKIDLKNRKKTYICGFSERDMCSISKTISLLKKTAEETSNLWYAIVDEEGDITYYDVSLQDMRGSVAQHKYSKGQAVLLKNRVVIFKKDLATSLFEKEFYGKPFGDGLQLSLVEGLYLHKKKVIDLHSTDNKKLTHTQLYKPILKLQPDIKKRLMVFSDLKQKGLIVKTGFKFGVHFRAYIKPPDKTHAEYLVHVVDVDFTSIWAEMSRAVRLAHSVNKEILFAQISNKKISYVKFGRLRP
ncbi:MAG: tRNA-intron lyase [Thermoplasmatota archaeon]